MLFSTLFFKNPVLGNNDYFVSNENIIKTSIIEIARIIWPYSEVDTYWAELTHLKTIVKENDYLKWWSTRQYGACHSVVYNSDIDATLIESIRVRVLDQDLTFQTLRQKPNKTTFTFRFAS